jgi:hypothetical protein
VICERENGDLFAVSLQQTPSTRMILTKTVVSVIHKTDSLFFSGTIDNTDSSIDIISGLSPSIEKEPSAMSILFSPVSMPTTNAN